MRAALATALALGLAACAGPPGRSAVAGEAEESDPRPVVVATFTVLADIARNVAGDHVRVESLTRVGAEIHGYEPTPHDIARAGDADLVLASGLGLEAWLGQFLLDAGARHVSLGDTVETLPIAGSDEANPHAWMSPSTAVVYVEGVVDALSDLDPAHAADFAANGAAYAEQVERVGEELARDLAAVPVRQRVLVTCEGAFSYLARDAGLAEVYLWPVNAEQQSTPRQVAAVIDEVRAREVPAVFCESTVSAAGMRQVARETGAAVGGTLYVDSLSEPDGPVPTYLDLLRHDARTIAAGLTGTGDLGARQDES